MKEIVVKASKPHHIRDMESGGYIFRVDPRITGDDVERVLYNLGFKREADKTDLVGLITRDYSIRIEKLPNSRLHINFQCPDDSRYLVANITSGGFSIHGKWDWGLDELLRDNVKYSEQKRFVQGFEYACFKFIARSLDMELKKKQAFSKRP